MSKTYKNVLLIPLLSFLTIILSIFEYIDSILRKYDDIFVRDTDITYSPILLLKFELFNN